MYLLLAFLAILYSAECQKEVSVNIVGGEDADIQDYPFLVSIRNNYNHVCGGSILTRRHILTAAHCVVPFRSNPLSLSIQYGLASITTDATNSIPVAHFVYHPEFINVQPWANDIAIITLKRSIPMSKNAAEIMLPNEPSTAGATATVAGWGITANGGQVSKDLQEVDLEIYSDDKCVREVSPYTNPRYHICAKAPGVGKSECSGDSGGPLEVDCVIYGIVSWSDKPCGEFPGVFTNVFNYVNWIDEQVDFWLM